MKPISSSDQKAVVAGIVEDSLAQAPAEPSFTPEEKAYYRSLREAVLYLDTYLAKGPGFAHAPKPEKGSEEFRRQRDWVVGYARPLKLAGVAAIDLMPAADRFMARSGDVKYFPTPPQLIECADACRSDRLAKSPPPPEPLPLDAPRLDPLSEERRRISNQIRQKMGLPLIEDRRSS